MKAFVQRHPLLTLLLIFNTFGQAVAFVPVVASRVYGVQLDVDWILAAATILFLLVPALVITWITGGREGLRDLLTKVFRFRVSWRWYLLPLVLIPLVIAGQALALDPSTLVPAYGTAFLPALAFQFLSTNWWEEAVWMGFFQAPLQDRYGPMKAVLITTPFFALEHLSVVTGVVPFVLLTLIIIPARALFAWIYNRTGSVALAGLAHAATNAAAFGMVPALTGSTGDSGMTLLVLGLVVIVATRGRLGRPRVARTDDRALTSVDGRLGS
ncbi:CPBP family intramembrane metalloprotease [Actinoplanes bogorensis]|uniref:CPBP family intramembrane metalloprotease n=1 Tax=Paractinoplanes bogorensis TaxID=1610840 RepID=A0ABS5YJN1_9ACTN|nr:CPBP family intramembrane glutamic endopeptidase [Actinoplanes bogorensis]MBU2663607.1 CPBP family intramembrane metalloprotease [Actinoplanes bogorensis]